MYTEEFDKVICSSGHFSVPNASYFEGLDSFNDRVLHAHDFRNALNFKNKDILIVGRSYSAEDIGSQCWKYGAKSVTTTYRSKPMGFKCPENFEERPLLQTIVGKTAHFKDGSTKDVDAIILCTGYQHHFPFLTEELRLKTAKLVIFDLDLFEPTHAAWKEISPHLRQGDILYFDQAFDIEGERLLIDEYVMKEQKVKLVGRSVIGCVMEIL